MLLFLAELFDELKLPRGRLISERSERLLDLLGFLLDARIVNIRNSDAWVFPHFRYLFFRRRFVASELHNPSDGIPECFADSPRLCHREDSVLIEPLFPSFRARTKC